MKVIFSLYVLLIIIFFILSLIINKNQENQKQKYCKLLVKNKMKIKEITEFIKIKHNDILCKKTKFEKDYSNLKSLHSIAELATFASLYAVYREELLLKEIENFIKE